MISKSKVMWDSTLQQAAKKPLIQMQWCYCDWRVDNSLCDARVVPLPYAPGARAC